MNKYKNELKSVNLVMGVGGSFDVVSGEVKMRKPFDEIYHHLFEKYNINPKTAVFIDDSKPNIETALKLGLQGIHFQSPEQLAQDLKELGVTYKL